MPVFFGLRYRAKEHDNTGRAGFDRIGQRIRGFADRMLTAWVVRKILRAGIEVYDRVYRVRSQRLKGALMFKLTRSAPCKGCTERESGCHMTCWAYIEYNAKNCAIRALRARWLTALPWIKAKRGGQR